jgi:MFS family permease
VSGISFLQDAASEMLYPILPIFLTTVLGAPAGIVGVVEGAAEGAAAVTKAVSGRLSDRYRRRPLIGLGYGLAALGKMLIAVATLWPVVLAGRCVDRLGKGVRSSPRDALIADEVPEAARGRAFGFHRGMDTAGAVVGPLAGLGLYHLLDGQLRPLLVVAVLPAVASVALVAAIRDPSRPARARPAPAVTTTTATVTTTTATTVRPGRLPTRFWQVTALLTVFSLVNFPDALLLLRLHEIGFSVSAVIGAYITYNAVYALLSYPAGALADRLPRAGVFGLGLVFFAVTYTGLGLTRDHTTAWLLLTAYGAYTACTDGVGKAWVSGLLPTSAQGSGQGVFQGLSGVGVLGAGLWAGLLWGVDGSTPLLVSGLLSAALAIGLLTAAIMTHPRTP